MKQGMDVIREILGRRDAPPSGSGFLDAVARLRFDRHDVRGCAYLASQAVRDIPDDDPARPALLIVAGTACNRNEDAGRSMTAIFALCDETIEAQEATDEAAPSAPVP